MASADRQRLVRHAGIVSFFTLISRVLGFVRDIVLARGFGAGMGADAFFVALKLPNFLRRLFAEGAFNTAFVPVFSDYLTKGAREETSEVVKTVFTLLATILMGVVLLSQIIMPLLIMAAAPGFIDQPVKFDLTVTLTRITYPYIFFISLTALAGGILNSLHRFAVPAFTPSLLNVALIFGALYLAPMFDRPVLGLAWGVFLGGVIQFAIQIPALKKAGMSFGFRWNPKHPAVKRILKLMGPSILGVSVAQVNLLFDILIASFLPVGSISFLYYADRLVEFPLGLFGIALATAILPALSAKAAKGDQEGLHHDLDFALRLVAVISIPATVGLVILAGPILSLLFERGAFGAETTALTAQALWAYAFGLTAFSGVKIAAPAFYAMKDTRTPVRIAIIALVANMVMNVAFMIPFKHAGLALATSMAAYLNVGLLLKALRAKTGFSLGRGFFLTLGKVSAASGVMALFLLWGRGAFYDPGAGTGEKALVLLPLIGAAMGLFFAAAWLFRLTELRDLIRTIRRKKAAKN